MVKGLSWRMRKKYIDPALWDGVRWILDSIRESDSEIIKQLSDKH